MQDFSERHNIQVCFTTPDNVGKNYIFDQKCDSQAQHENA